MADEILLPGSIQSSSIYIVPLTLHPLTHSLTSIKNVVISPTSPCGTCAFHPRCSRCRPQRWCWSQAQRYRPSLRSHVRL